MDASEMKMDVWDWDFNYTHETELRLVREIPSQINRVTSIQDSMILSNEDQVQIQLSSQVLLERNECLGI